jgi:15-cis-phytoene synthase
MTALAGHVGPITPQAVMNHHAKSFSWAARFLNTSARHDAALLYAFARTADDLADEARFGSLLERTELLQMLRRQALQPTRSAQKTHEQAVAEKTSSMLRRYSVPDAVLATFMDSLQIDASARHIDSTSNMLRFAYGVAGTVGQMMRPLLGAPLAADPYAITLGIAMQLTNIARDVVEDAQRGRCYIPAEWGVTLQSMSAPKNAAERADMFSALQRLLTLADDFYAFARAGMLCIPPDNRRAVRIAAALYHGIGRKILRGGPNLYWQGRVALTRAEKLKLIAQTLLFEEFPYAATGRDVWRDDLSHLVGVPGFPST